MKEYIFFTFEGYTMDPFGNDVENCQLIGRSFGKNSQEALSSLLSKNAWIKEHGFDPNKFLCEELVISKCI